MTVLQYLQTHKDNHIDAPCAGNGTCGKCLIQIHSNCPPPTETEKSRLSLQQLEDGYRLACCVAFLPDMDFVLRGTNDKKGKNVKSAEFSILTDYQDTEDVSFSPKTIADVGELGLAIDIGTTTIVFSLVETRGAICSHAVINSQRALGSDVISRIQQANEGHLEQLHQYVVEDIRQGIAYICGKLSQKLSENISEECSFEYSLEILEKIRSVVIAGNTTMLHILLNTPCNSLGVYPFTPVFLDKQNHKFSDIFGDYSDFENFGIFSIPNDFGAFSKKVCGIEVLILPGISTFVGADISAGIFFCQLKSKKPWLLIDLGTNGEMALFSANDIVATSTAAGPAFEGGNISCGTGSISGAISKAVYQPEKKAFAIETIDNQPPVGICGSGVLDIVAQLVKHGLIDESGLLDEDEFEDGFVTIAPEIQFTQRDIREFQLAKSAIRAGLEVLLAETSNTYDSIEHVFVAGGFGHKMSLESAILIGMLPSEWKQKITAVGNTALGGCVKVLTINADIDKITASGKEYTEETSVEQKELFADLAKTVPMILDDFERNIKNAQEINLSTHPLFNDGFMEYMMFENASDRKV